MRKRRALGFDGQLLLDAMRFLCLASHHDGETFA